MVAEPLQRLDPTQFSSDLCVIDAEGSSTAAISAARFCTQAMRGRGVIVFRDRTLIARALIRFLGELSSYRAYPLAHDLLVLELAVPSLRSDSRVENAIARPVWRTIDRLGAMRSALRLASVARVLEWTLWNVIFPLTMPRRHRTKHRSLRPSPTGTFSVYTFMTDGAQYEQMNASFIAAGFQPDGFVCLADSADDPYAVVNRISAQADVRYPILCHQDVRLDQGAGAEDLLRTLDQLDAIDRYWVVAGTAGVTRSGRHVRRLTDPSGGPSHGALPSPVVSLDENFLVFNGRARARCTPELTGFHLYGTDVCLHALSSGGSAYVIDFPLTHLSSGSRGTDYDVCRRRLIAAWSKKSIFRFVMTHTGGLFFSRVPWLRQLFGSERVIRYVEDASRNPEVLRRSLPSWAPMLSFLPRAGGRAEKFTAGDHVPRTNPVARLRRHS